MIFVIVLLVMGGVGFFYLKNYPSEVVNSILNNSQQNNFDFMGKTYLFLNPVTLRDVPEVKNFVENLRDKIINRVEGGVRKFRFKTSMTKTKEGGYQVRRVTAKLVFSEATQETIQFDFIRYDWWRWTILNAKLLNYVVGDKKYR